MNKTLPTRSLLLVILLCLLAGGPRIAAIPVTRMVEADGTLVHPPIVVPWALGFDQFRASLQNGNSDVLVGVFAPNAFAFPVVQQPGKNATYVDTHPGVVTQFAAPSSYGTVGLLAHDNLAGADFYKLQAGETFFLVYGDGSVKPFMVEEIRQFQALQPENPYSNFLDLEHPSDQLTSGQVFSEIYAHPNQVVFQTCLDRDGDPSWGRTFIIAAPRTLSSMLSIPTYRSVFAD
jgi:hypothetical protein